MKENRQLHQRIRNHCQDHEQTNLPNFSGSGVEASIISRTGGKWQTNFIKTENYSLVYYGGILGLGGTTIGRGEQMGHGKSR